MDEFLRGGSDFFNTGGSTWRRAATSALGSPPSWAGVRHDPAKTSRTARVRVAGGPEMIIQAELATTAEDGVVLEQGPAGQQVGVTPPAALPITSRRTES